MPLPLQFWGPLFISKTGKELSIKLLDYLDQFSSIYTEFLLVHKLGGKFLIHIDYFD